MRILARPGSFLATKFLRSGVMAQTYVHAAVGLHPELRMPCPAAPISLSDVEESSYSFTGVSGINTTVRWVIVFQKPGLVSGGEDFSKSMKAGWLGGHGGSSCSTIR